MKAAYLIFRVLTLLLGLLGCLGYFFLVYFGVHGWSEAAEATHSGFWERLGTFFATAIFFTGLPPFMITIYFLLRCTRPADWLAGLGWLGLFVFTQYVSGVFVAHATWLTYALIIVVDLDAAIAVILI